MVIRALFGYEGQTNDLKVVACGSGGLDELNEELNSGKIMYAFVRVADPKTSLSKNILINWQVSIWPAVCACCGSESVPLIR